MNLMEVTIGQGTHVAARFPYGFMLADVFSKYIVFSCNRRFQTLIMRLWGSWLVCLIVTISRLGMTASLIHLNYQHTYTHYIAGCSISRKPLGRLASEPLILEQEQYMAVSP